VLRGRTLNLVIGPSLRGSPECALKISESLLGRMLLKILPKCEVRVIKLEPSPFYFVETWVTIKSMWAVDIHWAEDFQWEMMASQVYSQLSGQEKHGQEVKVIMYHEHAWSFLRISCSCNVLSRQLVQPSSSLHCSVLGEKYPQSIHVKEERGMEEHSATH
jgi:hypothetical protein